MQPTWKYVALCRSMKPLQLILIQDENSQVQIPEARAHDQEYNEHLILVVCTWDCK